MRRNFDTADAIRPVALACAASEPPAEVVERAKVILRSGYDEQGIWQEDEELEEPVRVPDEDCGAFVQADVAF